jgi:GNAT superfamily N-acetyltransferase
VDIREATPEDIPTLVEQGREFWKSTRYSIADHRPYRPDAVATLCEWLMEEGGFIVVLVDDDDVVRGHGLVAVTPFLFDPDIWSAMELAYYIDPDYRGHGTRLLYAMEDEARRRDAEYLSMITMESSMPEVVGGIYNKLGYSKNETVFTKEL